MESSKAYYSFQSKSSRDITSPKKELKVVQKRINILLSRIEIPDWVHGGVKKRSIQTNAAAHKEPDVFLRFFDNCSRERIYQFFYSKLKLSKDVAKIMTDVTTYKNKLVTGSPTSGYLYEDMFTEINEFVTKENMIMTLYVDDITISGDKKINNLSELAACIDKK